MASCGEGPGGDFQDSKPVIIVTESEGKSTAKLGNRAAENQLITVLAKKLGISVDVTTNRLSGLPTIAGDHQSVEQLLKFLDVDTTQT